MRSTTEAALNACMELYSVFNPSLLLAGFAMGDSKFSPNAV